jgi:hypothetical protein
MTTNTNEKDMPSAGELTCDMCDTTDSSVGLSGCDHPEHALIKVCKYCDIDGSSYNGWCDGRSDVECYSDLEASRVGCHSCPRLDFCDETEQICVDCAKPTEMYICSCVQCGNLTKP